MNRLLSIFLVSLMSLSLMGQTDRPKVGLVLSGGSAHGLAHIGVLKVLEEQGVHVDYVTGTSMGSIIGGLFAMGLTADEIEELTEEQDWDQLLSTNVPLKEIAPSEKLYHDRFGLTLEIRKDGIKLPQGFLNSQKLDLQLNRMFCPAHDIEDFDNLAYPFKCVAVNIENGDVEVLDSGYLGTAVRSSMAIPSVFAPVEMDGKLLVDGGLIRNFPVEEVQAMGADIVIGVYVGSKLEDKSKLNNLLEILNQSAFMMGVLDSEEQKKKVDILIEPDVKDFASFGFDNSNELVREGYISAMRQLEDIKALGVRQKSYTTVVPEALEDIDFVQLAGTRFPFIRNPFDELANFKYGHLNKKGNVNLTRIEKGITRIFGTKHFDNINYTFQTNSRGEKVLNVLAKPRKVNTISGTFNFMPSSSTSLILTNELRNVIDEPSVLYTTVRIAENYGVKMDYNYRLGKKKDFILNVLGQVHRYDQNLYESEILRERYAETKVTASIGVGYEPNNEVLIKATTGIDGFGFKPVGLDDEGLERYRRFDATLIGEIVYDNIDDIQFPNNGISIGIAGGVHEPLNSQLTEGQQNPIYIPENKLYIDGHVKGKAVRSLTPRIAVIGGIAAGIKTQESLTDNYRVGGLEDRDYKSISMIGLNTHQIHMSQFFRGSAEIRWQMFGSFYTTLRADYLSGMQTFVLKDLNEDPDRSLWGYGAVIGLKTPLGPMRFAYGRNSLTESWNTNFTFGYTFF